MLRWREDMGGRLPNITDYLFPYETNERVGRDNMYATVRNSVDDVGLSLNRMPKTNGQMDGQTDGCIDGRTDATKYIISLLR